MRTSLLLSIILTFAFGYPAFAQCPGYAVHTTNGTFTNWFGYQAPPMAESTNPSDVLHYPGMGTVPYLNSYFTNSYAQHTYSNAHVHAMVHALCVNTGQPVHFFNYSEESNPVVWSSYLGIRIIHGMVFGNNFVSVILPSTWTYSLTPDRHPLVVHSSYDVNQEMFTTSSHSSGHRVAHIVARSIAGGRPGAIGLLWNGGASATSVTGNLQARIDFDWILNQLKVPLGFRTTSTYIFGHSRGGSTALLLASSPTNPAATLSYVNRTSGYKVKWVTAIAPGVKFGEHADLISATLPRQLSAFGHATGFAKAWTPGWTYPIAIGPLLGMTAENATRFNLFGYASMAQADQMGPTDPYFVNQLVADGVKVHLAVGSHDEYIPNGHQIDYLRQLMDAGVHYSAHVVLGGGHLTSNFANMVGGDIVCSSPPCGGLEDALSAELAGQSTPPTWNNAVVWTVNTSNGGGLQIVPGPQAPQVPELWMSQAWNSQTYFPSTIQFPARIMPGMKGYIFITGRRGAQVDMYYSISGGPPQKILMPNGTQPYIPVNSHSLALPFNSAAFPIGLVHITDAYIDGVQLPVSRPTQCVNSGESLRVSFETPNWNMTNVQASSHFMHASGCAIASVGYGTHRYPAW